MITKIARSLALGLVIAVTAVLPAGAVGTDWVETGDAGDTIASAQPTSGASPLNSISGGLDGALDDLVDMFALIASSSDLTASEAGTLTASNQLFLFDSSGAVLFSDTTSLFMPSISASGLTVGATYYLAISFFGVDPSGTYPTWNGTASDFGEYDIDLEGADPAVQAVAEPATLMLLGSGLLGLGAAAWRRRRG